MEPGDDFVAVITGAVASCDVLLAVIGERWSTITDEDGQRRLDNPEDFVRLEIEAALTRGIRVIPILVDGAKMPRADDLPGGLAKLARRHALELSPSRFAFDTSRLLRVLTKSLARDTQATPVVTAPAPDPDLSDAEWDVVLEPDGEPEEPAGPDGALPTLPDEPGSSSDPGRSEPGGPEPVRTGDLRLVPAQWAKDPFGAHEIRYWDGARWTEHVGDGGVIGKADPPGSVWSWPWDRS